MSNYIIRVINTPLQYLNVVFEPTVSAALVALGTLIVACEFLRPGLVFAGVIGGLLLVFGLHSLWVRPLDWPSQWPVAMALAVPVGAILIFLLLVARKARRNKRLTIF